MGRPFEKGDPRINSKGRPKKGESITDILKKLLDQSDESGKLRRVIVSEKLISLAESGDLASLKYLIDRIEGRPKESIELTDGAVDQRLREIMNE